jgi:hypothetical protein
MRPKVNLRDGSAYAIIAECRRAAKKAGWSEDMINAVSAEMKSGDYDHLLQTAMKHFDV